MTRKFFWCRSLPLPVPVRRDWVRGSPRAAPRAARPASRMRTSAARVGPARGPGAFRRFCSDAADPGLAASSSLRRAHPGHAGRPPEPVPPGLDPAAVSRVPFRPAGPRGQVPRPRSAGSRWAPRGRGGRAEANPLLSRYGDSHPVKWNGLSIRGSLPARGFSITDLSRMGEKQHLLTRVPVRERRWVAARAGWLTPAPPPCAPGVCAPRDLLHADRLCRTLTPVSRRRSCTRTSPP